MILREEMSRDFFELLSRTGWSPDRRVETDYWVSTLEREGFRSNPAAIAILESVGGLRVHLPPAGIKTYEHELRFDPVTAATGEVDRANDWKRELGVDLFPLGEVDGGYVIWAGDDGQLYYGRDFGLYRLGQSFGIAMDQLAFPDSPMVRCAE